MFIMYGNISSPRILKRKNGTVLLEISSDKIWNTISKRGMLCLRLLSCLPPLTKYRNKMVTKNKRKNCWFISRKVNVSYYFRDIVVLQGLMSRQSSFIKDWFFQCHCQRCTDETEFGTFTSCIKCVECSKRTCDGYVLNLILSFNYYGYAIIFVFIST